MHKINIVRHWILIYKKKKKNLGFYNLDCEPTNILFSSEWKVKIVICSEAILNLANNTPS